MGRPGRKRRKYSQAARVLQLLDHVRGRRYGVALADLAEEFGVTERQARRDLAAIEEAGYSWEWLTVRGRTGVRLLEGSPGGLRLTLRERYSLLAVRRVFDVLEETPLFEDVRSIFDKVAASLPHEQQEDLASFGDRFAYVPDGGPKAYRGKGDVLDALLTGVIRRRQVRCRYRSSRANVRDGVLDPYAMALYRHGLYVIGALNDGSGVRTFAAERFSEATFVPGSSFEVPEDFDVERYFDGAFGLFTGGTPQRVVAEFEPEVAHLLGDRRWHRSQKTSRLEGGRTRVELTVTNLTSVVQWLVGWGPWVRVISPPDLRQRVAEEHERALRRPKRKRPS